METQPFFGHISTPRFDNPLQINPLQTRSVAASRHPHQMEGQDLVEGGTCLGKNTGKDHVDGEAPAEVEPLEAWSPMTL